MHSVYESHTDNTSKFKDLINIRISECIFDRNELYGPGNIMKFNITKGLASANKMLRRNASAGNAASYSFAL